MKEKKIKLSPGEQLVYQAALLRKGSFHAKCEVIHEDSKSIILFDGERMYPLGEIEKGQQIEWPQYMSILGRVKNVTALLQMNKNKHSNYKKHFAFLDRSRLEEIKIPKYYSFELAENVRAFCALKNSFIKEESGEKIDISMCEMQLRNQYSNFKPCLMKFKEAVIGMVSSQIHSDKGAIINMLFIDGEFRGKGLGRLLLSFYINQLKKNHSDLALFFSPQNIQAANLYKKLGFEIKETWTLSFKLKK